ncbi:hypothetical protein NUM_31930 [Actinocatenispora comari]|uniref:Uncharacterized protein n=1 Tax=Actinocatenispora comari TaxID=2807577 RepID=A0A8J4ENQ7_9ACTN|nr:hypothetical protein NUM_31930 [Actinocatenispora comari]
MAIVCGTCQHPEPDHFDGVCWHNSPEDRCCEVPDLRSPQCLCEEHRPHPRPPADPTPVRERAVCGTLRPAGRRPLPRTLARSGVAAGAPAGQHPGHHGHRQHHQHPATDREVAVRLGQ